LTAVVIRIDWIFWKNSQDPGPTLTYEYAETGPQKLSFSG
jgi:hypothetical protein